MSVRMSPCSDADNNHCFGPSCSFLYQRNDKRQNPAASRKKGRGRAAFLKLSHVQLVRGVGPRRLDKSVTVWNPISISASDCHALQSFSFAFLHHEFPVTMLPGACFVIMPPVTSVPGASDIASGRIVLRWRPTRAVGRCVRQAGGGGYRPPCLLKLSLRVQLQGSGDLFSAQLSCSNARGVA